MAPGLIAFLVAFGAVVIGWALSLDYSAKLFVMTFVLVVMGSEGASGAAPSSSTTLLSCLEWTWLSTRAC